MEDHAPSPDSSHNHYFTPEQLRQTAESIENAIAHSNYKGRYYIFASDEGGLRLDIDNYEIVLLRSGAIEGDVSHAWDSRIVSPNPNVKYDYIYAVFDENLQGSILTFKSYTTLNVGNGSGEISVKNEANVASLNFSGKDSDQMSYKSVAIKYDSGKDEEGHDYSESKGSDLTVHNQKDLPVGENGEHLLKWTIKVNLPADMEYDSDVIITETLPEGIKVAQLPSEHEGAEAIVFHVVGGDGYGLNTRAKAGFNFIPGSSYPISRGDGTTIVSTDAMGICTLSKEKDHSVTAKKSADGQTYTIFISPELANYLTEKNNKPRHIEIEISAYIEDDFDWSSFEHDFTNNVTVEYRNHELGDASQTQTIYRNVISKEHGEYKSDTSTIPYTIEINPDGADLAIGADILTLTDTLKYTMPAGKTVNAALMYNSLHVIDTRSSKDITSQCSFTVSDGQDSGKVSHTIVMTVPDSTPIEVKYDYKMSGEGRLSDLTNTATLEGSGGSTSEAEDLYDVAVQQSGAGATVVGVNVYKVDSQNYAVHLNGAKFKLEKWNGTAWDSVKIYETGEDGKFNTGALDYYVAYRLTETEAPAGYEMKQAAVYEFYVIKPGYSNAVNAPDNFNGKALNDDDTIYIENDAAPYELPETGGMGTAMYYAAGGMLMLAAAGLAVFRKRRSTAR